MSSLYTTQDYIQEIQSKSSLLELCALRPEEVPMLWKSFATIVRGALFRDSPLTVVVKDWITFVAPGIVRFSPSFLKGNGLHVRERRMIPSDQPTPGRSLVTLYRDIGAALGISAHNVDCCLRHMAQALGEVMRDPKERRISVEIEGVGAITSHKQVVEFVWAGSERCPTPMPSGRTTPNRSATPQVQPTPNAAPPLPPRSVTPVTMSLRQEPLPLPPLALPGSKPLPPIPRTPSVQATPHSSKSQTTPHRMMHPSVARETMSTTSLSLSQPIYAVPKTFKMANQFSVDAVMDLAMSRHAKELEAARKSREDEARNAVLEQELHRRLLALEKKRKEKSQRMTHDVLQLQMTEHKLATSLPKETNTETCVVPTSEGINRIKIRAEQQKLRQALDQQVTQRRADVATEKSKVRVQEIEALQRVKNDIELEKVEVRNRLTHMQKVLAAAWEAQIQLEHAKKT